MRRNHRLPLLVLAALLLAGGAACAKKYAAEQDGKDVGQSLCDIHEATTQQEAAEATKEFEAQVDDVTENYLSFTAEDRADIREQVSDLSEHAGDELLVQQDLTVIRRSLENIREDLGESGRATIDGVFQGLDDCVPD